MASLLVERLGDTLVRIAFDPADYDIQRYGWVKLHTQLNISSGGAISIDLDHLFAGIVVVNLNPTQTAHPIDREGVIHAVLEYLQSVSIRADREILTDL